MAIEEIKKFDGSIVELETLEEIEESEFVVDSTFNGYSGENFDMKWYSITLTDGEEIQLYLD